MAKDWWNNPAIGDCEKAERLLDKMANYGMQRDENDRAHVTPQRMENIMHTEDLPYATSKSFANENEAKTPSFFQEMREQFAREFSMLDDAINILAGRVQFVCTPDTPTPVDPSTEAQASTDLEAFANESLRRIQYARWAVQNISDRVKL